MPGTEKNRGLELVHGQRFAGPVHHAHSSAHATGSRHHVIVIVGFTLHRDVDILDDITTVTYNLAESAFVGLAFLNSGRIGDGKDIVGILSRSRTTGELTMNDNASTTRAPASATSSQV